MAVSNVRTSQGTYVRRSPNLWRVGYVSAMMFSVPKSFGNADSLSTVRQDGRPPHDTEGLLIR